MRISSFGTCSCKSWFYPHFYLPSPRNCYIWSVMKRAVECQVRRFPFLWASAVVVGACCPLLTAHPQETSDRESDDAETIEEIIVVVDRDGRPVDIYALRLEEAVLEIIQKFELEQTKQEEELWRLKLRSAIGRNTSRITWGYDAQRDAASVRYSRASYLPIDRVRPATVISVRF